MHLNSLSATRSHHRPTFILRIEGKPGADNIRALRWLLKSLLRLHGFRCVEAIEEREHGGRR
jgi:hypothetical protein